MAKVHETSSTVVYRKEGAKGSWAKDKETGDRDWIPDGKKAKSYKFDSKKRKR